MNGGIGLNPIQTRNRAYQYAEANSIEYWFNREMKASENNWFKYFSERNNLRNPQAFQWWCPHTKQDVKGVCVFFVFCHP